MTPVIKKLVLIAFSMGLMAGCSNMHKATQSQRAAIEQLLVSEAVLRSLSNGTDDVLSIPQGANVIIDTSGISSDQIFLQKTLAGWLGQQGYTVQKNEEKAAYRISVIVRALGTELGDSFFGMPPVTSQLIPFSLPELALYKAQYQTGYAKFHMDVFELPGGRFVQSTPPFLAETYYNDHTILLLFSFSSTDLESPPQLGAFRKRAGTQNTWMKDKPSEAENERRKAPSIE